MELENIGTPLYDFLIDQGFSTLAAGLTRAFLSIVLLFILVFLINFFGKKAFLNTVARFTSKTKTNADDILMKNQVFNRITLLFPAFGIYAFDRFILVHAEIIQPFVVKGTNIYSIAVIASIISSVLVSLEQILEGTKAFKNKPLTSYRQLINIFNYAIAGILIVSLVIDKSPTYLLSALGAATAVIILVFRDSILGFTASIQLAGNDMVRVGDWVTVDSYGADGDVTEITLNTIKVKNFDNTITTVPTYAFISNSFRNWRGMQDSGGRRIKRAISLKIDSVKFADEALFENLRKVDIIEQFLIEKQSEIDSYNNKNNVNTEVPINGRRQTNLGLFRKYLGFYLDHHPKISKDLTKMVRQLPANEHGVPLEIYCFSTDKVWVNYEGIMADIFDHVYAAAPYFDLEIFQQPTSHDILKLKS